MSTLKRTLLSRAEQVRLVGLLQKQLKDCRGALVRQWGRLGHDLFEEAAGEIWLRLNEGHFDPAKGDFSAWCQVVLRRIMYSKGRKARSRSRREKNVNHQSTRHPVETACAGSDVDLEIRDRDAQQFLVQPFPRRDLEQVCQWSLKDRIILLSLSVLWSRIPRDLWQRWVFVYRRRYGMKRALPLAELQLLATPKLRQAPLASALGVPTNTLSQRWRRNKREISQLSCVQELMHDTPRFSSPGHGDAGQ